ncbi:MAG: Transcriptional regulator, MerR family [candidate division TM6 bacterium GW2011_GWF2_28_16]|jgi:DNA-binding transcriptional MerR regulator|nr:MAG: Transcriptional regulator, MerR family [candidate division TM6 bacterium GW2011_GWF2_28_16]
MEQKIKMDQRKFRIGELAEQLNVKKFVIRFWEKEFGLRSDRSGGGQRFYSQDDFNKFALIKSLLYEQKFTIPGAKNQLKNMNEITPAITENFTSNVTEEALIQENMKAQEEFKNNYQIINEKLEVLKKQLINLQQRL